MVDAQEDEAGGRVGSGNGTGTLGEGSEAVTRPHPLWAVMSALVGLDFLLGIGAILAVPYGRPTIWVPHKGQGVYMAHALIGALLGLGAVYAAARYGSANERILRLAARTGMIGIAIAVVGGLLAVSHPLRLVGMGIMLIGSLVAGIGYLMPTLEAHDKKERAELSARYQEGGEPQR